MASLKDRLKSKIKPKNQPITLEAFDQTSINVQLIQGKNQLQQLLIYCSWNNNKYNHIRPPKLKCRWYNRTEKNLEQIQGIEEEKYQTSVADIGSIIEVTCIPELPDVNYEGMPILLKSQPITLATQTENQANYMLQEDKGKILVHIKQSHLSECHINYNSEALLQIEKGELSLLWLLGQSNEQEVMRVEINEEYPQVKINRKNPKEMLLMWNEKEYCTLWFKNSEIRDTFCLFLKLFVARKSLNGELQKMQNEHKQQIVKVQSEGSLQQKQQQNQSTTEIINHQEKQKEAKFDSIHKTSTIQLLQLVSLKQELKHFEQQNHRLAKQLEQQKEMTFNLENKVNETNERLQSASRNYFELQQQLNAKEQEVQRLKQQISQNTSSKQSKQQEFMYYTNEIKILNQDKTSLSGQLLQLKEKCELLEEELELYRASSSGQNENNYTYSQLLEEVNKLRKENQEIRLKHEYQVGQKQQLEDNLRSSRDIIEQITSEKKYIEKKYESLTNELNSSTVSPNNYSSKMSNKSGQSSPEGSMILDDIPHIQSSSSFGVQKKDSLMRMISCQSEQRQKELLELKQHIKQYVEENNYLRNLLSKQKKSSSKTQLKLELFEVKKIVNRLTQAVTQKDLELKEIRQINKELNLRNSQILQQYNEMLQK